MPADPLASDKTARIAMLMEQYRHERQLRKSVEAEVERLQLLVKSNLTEANLQRHTGEGNNYLTKN
jgi:hypothetical protein